MGDEPAAVMERLTEALNDTGSSGSPLPWDPMEDYAVMKRNTEDFMTLWKSAKPTIAKIHGHAVAGGSDIALCCDLMVMAEDAAVRRNRLALLARLHRLFLAVADLSRLQG